ncbi:MULTISPECIES: DUF523 domain-containing protein [unclassified Breznakia]|uniref:DUF523 domain-containing protein n=1 Tax=unclassified Breznakia TaxID=2623764 RepID=UPI00247681CD|nr:MULTISPECIES: DUF523 domain-containing protein [unclassified Breznakia]MDH6368161.1 uncharacterized protein YbbK (DUF523 family) [Breznakia sp. PH1-1]MDH6405246.1 uncharacterized protein YbbK (DUF523 family) [Breznakia sp. PF1-11]MDH6412964.1 uncharacterized protein YbbK (DUF523 family) [Breznakia sp. PFB1-11]MDH6415322.1 uncharacterized protein YbbK (DUF523 family) [Breznakia sp. PFB1-14]MDH6417630.1 uncharacterized protein YbbK (DUF523 family) [Breznakia sp. PFB1-4]
MKEKILVSACLLGENCSYRGDSNYDEAVITYLKDKDIVPVCPEVLGGLSTPRAPSERIGNKIINNLGEDVTKEFHAGANAVIKIVKEQNIKKAILKDRSPSCGLDEIYDGTFQHKIIQGDGILVEMLKNIGVEVINCKKITN